MFGSVGAPGAPRRAAPGRCRLARATRARVPAILGRRLGWTPSGRSASGRSRPGRGGARSCRAWGAGSYRETRPGPCRRRREERDRGPGGGEVPGRAPFNDEQPGSIPTLSGIRPKVGDVGTRGERGSLPSLTSRTRGCTRHAGLGGVIWLGVDPRVVRFDDLAWSRAHALSSSSGRSSERPRHLSAT